MTEEALTEPGRRHLCRPDGGKILAVLVLPCLALRLKPRLELRQPLHVIAKLDSCAVNGGVVIGPRPAMLATAQWTLLFPCW